MFVVVIGIGLGTYLPAAVCNRHFFILTDPWIMDRIHLWSPVQLFEYAAV